MLVVRLNRLSFEMSAELIDVLGFVAFIAIE
jgi:hypothetical protein